MNKMIKSSIAIMAAIAMVGCCSECKREKCEDKECTAETCAEQSCADEQCSVASCDKEAVVVDNIMTRRSIRDYKDEPVDRKQMAKVLECGIYAPSAMNMQAWAVRVVDSKEFIDGVTAIAVKQNPQLMEQEGFRNFFRNAPTVAFIAIPEESYSGEFDSGLLAENMMLSAWSMGIGSCCLGSVIPVMNSEEARPYLERLELPDGYKLMIAIAFGYPAGEAPTAPARDASKAYYIE